MYNPMPQGVASQNVGSLNSGELKALGYFEDMAKRLEYLGSIISEEAQLHSRLGAMLHGEKPSSEKNAGVVAPAGRAAQITAAITMIQECAQRNLESTRETVLFFGAA